MLTLVITGFEVTFDSAVNSSLPPLVLLNQKCRTTRLHEREKSSEKLKEN